MKTFLFEKVFCVPLQRKRIGPMKLGKEENCKEDVKQKIIETALKEYRSRGIKEVKMDDIASLISVSKRTIYELFADKEVLILETLKLHHKIMQNEAKKAIKSSTDILDVILALYKLYFEQLKRTNRSFFTDLDRYPNARNGIRKNEKKDSKRFIAWMEEGRKQGLFREDADFNILSFVIKRDMELIMTANKQGAEGELGNYTPDELGRKLILFYLRGIATPKGQEKIEEFLYKI